MDKILWQTRNDQKVEFSTRQAWQNLRVNGPDVEWKKVIWFKQCIPRHAFMLWLAVQEKMLTQDRMAIWNKNEDLKCVFCNNIADSHDHLFFQCEFVNDIWKGLSQFMKKNKGLERLQDIIRNISSDDEKNKIDVVVRKLVVAASVYYNWQERNARIFKSQHRSKENLMQIIRNNVRMQLMNIKVRKTRNVEEIANTWELNWVKNTIKQECN